MNTHTSSLGNSSGQNLINQRLQNEIDMNEEFSLIHFSSFSTGYKNNSNSDEIGFNNLLGIIENGFRFNKGGTFTPIEPNGKPGIKLNIGMLCFTEVRLKEISGNINKFGKFGICMKRDWVKKYSGQPVLYTFEGSVNNKLLNDLNSLIPATNNLFLETNDFRLKQISLSIADISNHFQAITEIIKHKYENEWRIIDDPQNEVLQKSLVPWQKIEPVNNCEVYSTVFFLPISNGDDAEFFIMPKDYKELFCSRVVNPNNNKNKIVLLEDLLNV
jgi:hypothetical protein